LALVSASPTLAQVLLVNNSTGKARTEQPAGRVVGIEKSAMERLWALERETRSQVEAICTNSSVKPQQKRQQVREICEQAHQKMEGESLRRN
jgi:hypothetical protein